MKRTIGIMFVIVVSILFITACKTTEVISKTTEPITNSESEIKTEDNPSVKTQPLDEEIERAISLGIVPDELKEDYSASITEKELSSLLARMIELYDKSCLSAWNKLTKDATDNIMLRDYAAITLLYAAETLGIGENNERMNYYHHLDWDEMYDSRSWDYPMFPNYNDVLEYYSDFLGFPAGYADAAPAFVMKRWSNVNLNPLMTAENNSLRLDEYMTREEAILAVVRLYDSTIDTFVKPSEAINHTISVEVLEKAISMPVVSSTSLPNWHGTMLTYDTLPQTEGRFLFNKSDIQRIADMGFNYIRLGYNHYDFCIEDKAFKVDTTVLNNLDQVIEWCVELGIHLNIDMHTLPGYGSGMAISEWDILENTEHYEQALLIWDMFAKRYANVPSNALSYNLINEPIAFYLTEEKYAAFANDMINTIRKSDKEKLVVSDGMLINEWGGSKPNMLLSNDIVQTIHLYPYYKSEFINLLNWPYKKAYPVNSLISEKYPLIFVGDFPAGTVLTLYIDNAYLADINACIQLKADGVEVDRFSFDSIEVGKDNCEDIRPEDGRIRMAFESNGNNNGLVLKLTTPKDSKRLELKAIDSDDEATHIGFYELLLQTPSSTENLYAIPANYKRTGYVYETGRYNTTYIKGSVYWEELSSTVTIMSNGMYTASPDFSDVFDLETLEENLAKWAKWSKETGTPIMVNEFGVHFALPEKQRIGYLRSVLTLFDKYDIPWSLYANNYETWGPIVHKDSTEFCTLPPDESYVEKDQYYIDEAMLELLHEFMD